MRNCIITITLIILSFGSMAQSETKSIMYNKQGDKINISLDSLSKLNFNNKNYYHYLQKYSQSQKTAKTGRLLSIIGASSFSIGLGLLFVNDITNTRIMTTNAAGVLFTIAGGIAVNIGAPLWVSGAVTSKNNKHAMEQCQKKALSINIGISNNGVGLIFQF